jgi:hypothetical protein
MKTRRKWLIGGLAALLLAVAGVAVAQLPNTLNVSSAPSGTAPAIRAAGIDANVSINLIPKGSGTVQVNGSPVAVGGGTVTSLTINPGPLAVTGTTNLTGPLFTIPGTSVTLEQVGGAVVFNSSADFTPAAAAVEEDAYNFSLLANSLSANNQYLDISWAVTTAANANNKRARLYFGATAVCDSTAAGFNNMRLTARVTIWRTGAATQKAVCVGLQSTEVSWATAAGGGTNFSTPAENLAGAVTVRLTLLNATAAADSTARGINLLWYPAGQ